MTLQKTLNIQGNAGNLSCLLMQPEQTPQGVAVILHPNPLHGGTNQNKVVQTAAKALLQKGFLCILPNLRGVGESAGQHYRDNAPYDGLKRSAFFPCRHVCRSSLRHGVLCGYSATTHTRREEGVWQESATVSYCLT